MSDVRAEGGSDTEEEVVGEPLREMEGNKGREEGDRSEVTPERRADRPMVTSGQAAGGAVDAGDAGDAKWRGGME